MKKNFNVLYALIGLVVLFVLNKYIILPLVYDVIKSDAFLVENKDQESQYPISSEMTDLGYLHCNNYIKSQLDGDSALVFSSKPIRAWTLGNYHYLINGEVKMKGTSQKYVCRINYNNGDKQEGAQDFDNWSIEGIDGIEGL